MATITTRSGKGSPLTNNEVDANFNNLNTDKAELSGSAFTGAITTNSTIDGRDVATDGTKLDGIESGATADQTAAQIKTAYESNSDTNAFTDADHSKLDGIEASADVTDTTNVTAAGALMDSELTSIASVKALNQGVGTGDSPTFAALTSTGEITANGGIALGDSDKATFGAGDDLQIYHDGNHSYIEDAGTGSIKIKVGDFRVENASGNNLIKGVGDVASLHHAGSTKLATTSTGIDVTGTVTADNAEIGTGGASNANAIIDLTGDTTYTDFGFRILRNSGANGNTDLRHRGTGNLNIEAVEAGNIVFETSDTERLRIASNGAVLVGKTSGTAGNKIETNGRISAAAGSDSLPTFNCEGDTNTGINLPEADRIQFITGGSERMRIDSSGRLNVGQTNAYAPAGGGVSIGTFEESSNSRTNLVVSNQNSGNAAGASVVLASHGADYIIEHQGSGKGSALTFTRANTERFRIASDGSLSTPTAGTSNVRFGVNAGNSIVSGGDYNVVVGDEAGTAITTGDNNVAVGYASGDAITTGVSNTAIGSLSLSAATTANSNTAVGKQAATAITTGSDNVAMGSVSLTTNTTGANNVAIGRSALRYSTTASNNTAVGKSALAANTTGTFNVAVGTNALDANTTADNNTAVGGGALSSNTTGAQNTSLGTNALALNTTASYNTALGYQAVYSNLTGTELVGVGHNALIENTTGSYNVAIGGFALDANTTASNNTAVGYASLGANTTGDQNVAVGANAGNQVTTGIQNTLIGYLAGDALTDADYNTALGTSALTSDTLGSRAVAIGRNTLSSQNFTSATNNYNVAVGFSAGAQVTTGVQNTFVGGLSGDATTTANNNTAVGYASLGANTTGANNVALGNLALTANTTAGSNVALGDQSLKGNTTGASNTAVGQGSLQANTTASNNTAVGKDALDANTTGGANTAVGQGALGANTTGQANVAVGQHALQGNATSGGNTCIGREAGYYVTGGGNVVIGSANDGATSYIPAYNITSQSNYISMGSSAVTNAYVKVAWTVTSDARDKNNFAEVPHGLSFVNKLAPYSYEFKYKRTEDETDGIVRYGFKAQDILALEGDNPVIIDNQDPDSLRYRETALIPVLTKAIQELSAQVDALTARIETLEG